MPTHVAVVKGHGLTVADVERMTPTERLLIPIQTARALGLKTVDIIGGFSFIGTENQYEKEVFAAGIVNAPRLYTQRFGL